MVLGKQHLTRHIINLIFSININTRSMQFFSLVVLNFSEQKKKKSSLVCGGKRSSFGKLVHLYFVYVLHSAEKTSMNNDMNLKISHTF